MAASGLSLLLVSGCVSAGKHRDMVDERDRLLARQKQLDARVTALEASNKSLSDELASTLEQFEDLNVAHRRAVTELAESRAAERRLGDTLSEQSLQLVRTEQELAVASAEAERLEETYTALMSDLEAEVSAGQIQIEQLKEGIRVNVAQDILFPSGSAQLDKVGLEVLGRVARKLAEVDHLIEVQGHTDDRPIRGQLAQRYPTNWELASARASRVVRLLQEKGIAGDRLKVASFASYQPVAPNDTPEDRALNRRIEIRLKPVAGPVVREASARGEGE